MKQSQTQIYSQKHQKIQKTFQTFKKHQTSAFQPKPEVKPEVTWKQKPEVPVLTNILYSYPFTSTPKHNPVTSKNQSQNRTNQHLDQPATDSPEQEPRTNQNRQPGGGPVTNEVSPGRETNEVQATWDLEVDFLGKITPRVL